MKKQNANNNGEIPELFKALSQLDITQNPPKHPEQYFEQLVLTTKHNSKQKFLKDVVIFLILGIILATLTVVFLMNSPEFYLIIQVGILILFPAGLYLYNKKEKQVDPNAF